VSALHSQIPNNEPQTTILYQVSNQRGKGITGAVVSGSGSGTPSRAYQFTRSSLFSLTSDLSVDRTGSVV
jgi:hypothetical protein